MDRALYKKYMKQAIKLAKTARGSTHPNPMVGALIVKNNRIIASGYHKKCGQAHAEIVALRRAAKQAKGATLFVSLEPCSTYGRTPPCVDEIIKSGIKKVVIGTEDPNPLNRFKGIRKLRAHNIKVISGVLKKEASRLNEDFAKFIRKKIPFVTLKVAQSLDGKIATKSGDAKWISSLKSRKYAHKLRALNDAVMVGANTVIKDNPKLTCRYYRSSGRQPVRIIVDSRLKIKETARVFNNCKKDKVIVATTRFAPLVRIKRLKARGVDIIIAKSKNGLVDLRDLLKNLAKKDIVSLLVEGGSSIITSLLEEKLVDKMIIFISPKIIGGRQALTFYEGRGIKNMKAAVVLKDIRQRRIDDDLVIEGYIYPVR